MGIEAGKVSLSFINHKGAKSYIIDATDFCVAFVAFKTPEQTSPQVT